MVSLKNILLLILFSSSLFGVSASPGEKEFKQGDNSKFKGRLKGDEWFHWVETEDGYVAKYNKKSKDYEYMLLDCESNETRLLFSNTKVKSPSLKGGALLPSHIKKITPKQLGEIWKIQKNKKHPKKHVK